MFYYLQGTVAHTEPHLAVVDVGGVGYACHTSLNTLSGLRQGKPAKLYTYLHIREDIFDIYGFADMEELSCFKMLLGISGVGPRAALSILSSATPAQLALSIITGQEGALTVAPGVGKKLAQRIILELKDKMAKQKDIQGAPAAGMELPAGRDKVSEAAAALAVLGYGGGEVSRALEGLDVAALPLEELVKQALRRMAR